MAGKTPGSSFYLDRSWFLLYFIRLIFVDYDRKYKRTIEDGRGKTPVFKEVSLTLMDFRKKSRSLS